MSKDRLEILAATQPPRRGFRGSRDGEPRHFRPESGSAGFFNRKQEPKRHE